MKIDHAASPDVYTVYHYDTDDAYDRDGNFREVRTPQLQTPPCLARFP